MTSAPDPRRLAAQERAQAATDYVLTVELDGTTHVFRLGDVSALVAAEFRKATGLSVLRALAPFAVGDLGDAEAVAAVVWLARRLAGERPDWQQVAGSLTFGTSYAVTFGETDAEEGDVPDPPLSGAS